MKKYFLTFLSVILFITLIPLNYIFADQGTTISIKKIDNTKFPETIIYFSVFDSSGIAVKNLKKEDIEISENNETIPDLKIESVINNEFPSFISILIDNSGSMKGKPLEDAKAAAKTFISSLKDMDEVKIFTFNDSVAIAQDFTKDKNILNKAIDSIEIAGTKTVLNLAAYKGLQDLETKPAGQRFLVLLTDGKDEDISINADDAIELAKLNKIPIFSIGFGENFNSDSKKYDEEATKALNRFSILTGGIILVAAKEADLKASFGKISDILSYQYKVTYDSKVLKNGEEYEVTVSVNNLNEVVKDNIKAVSPELVVSIDISEFKDGEELKDKITITPKITIEPDKFRPEDEISKIIYYLDSRSYLLKETDEYPYSFELDTSLFEAGSHILIIEVIDLLGNNYSITRQFIIISAQKNYNIYIYSGIGLVLLVIAIILIVVFTKKSKKKKSSASKIIFTQAEGGSGSISSNLTNTDVNPEDISSGKGFSDDTFIDHREDFLDEDFGSKTIIKSLKEIKPNAWLVKVSGEHSGEEYSIPPEKSPDKRRITIGRSSYNDIVIDDDAASRENSFIIIENNEYKIGDMGSTNGTFLNDRKITSPKALNDGDKINI
ncbi:MAG: VWA domain-containing protein, partial [Actinobacteria bacterium]|nr:VWA domain-containing protein [Actinomycetota bacterium]